MSDSMSPRAIAATLTELWSPRVVADVDEHYVKVAKVHGTVGWTWSCSSSARPPCTPAAW